MCVDEKNGLVSRILLRIWIAPEHNLLPCSGITAEESHTPKRKPWPYKPCLNGHKLKTNLLSMYTGGDVLLLLLAAPLSKTCTLPGDAVGFAGQAHTQSMLCLPQQI